MKANHKAIEAANVTKNLRLYLDSDRRFREHVKIIIHCSAEKKPTTCFLCSSYFSRSKVRITFKIQHLLKYSHQTI